MYLNKYLSGKVALNQYANYIMQNSASFHVHYWGVMPNHYNTQCHKHSFFEACYVVDGEGIYIDDDMTYPLQKDKMFLSRPDILHQIKSKSGLFLLYIGFELIESESNEEWIRIMEKAKHCPKVVLDVKDHTTAALLWKSLLIQAAQPENAFLEDILTNLAYAFILSLLQTFVPSLQSENQGRLPKTSSPLLHQAKLYIRDNLAHPLKLTEVAGYLHISGRHLSRIFVSELGVSYSKFVKKERIQKAATLLKKTDLSINDIAEKTGFATVHYFTRVFTSEIGASPGHFRSLYIDLKTTSYNKSDLSLA
ncbi:AraC family transcriptional regulator [Scopulibacillus cellulosilyticus]|uniref:AraC family transcriptional regulator n=1 Tax=Scopulibacillus cellulosilyticus TaxID=2665665 RepID=A0ABW2PYG1_9BACL